MRVNLWIGRLLAVGALCGFVGVVPAFPQEPVKVPTLKKEIPPQTSAASGEEMYRSYCASCHGKSGKGDGPAAPALKQTPSDLTTLAKAGGQFPTAHFEEVLYGQTALPAHGSTDMPVWGSIFKKMAGNEKLRVYNLTKYVEGLQAR